MKKLPIKDLKIVNQSDHGELYIYGDIVDDMSASILQMFDIDGYTFPAGVKEQLDALKGKPLDVYINSDGGLVSAGMAIANMLKRHDAPTTAHVDGWAASIASVIALACDKVIMPSETFLMIHRPSCKAEGNVDDLKRAVGILDNFGEAILGIYADVSDTNKDEIWQKMVDETWLSAAEAAEIFKTVEVQAGGMRMVAQTDYKDAPEAVRTAYVKNYINKVLKETEL